MNCARTNVYAYRIYLDTSMRIVDQSVYVQSYARSNVTGSQAGRNKLRPYACLPGDDECAPCPGQRSSGRTQLNLSLRSRRELLDAVGADFGDVGVAIRVYGDGERAGELPLAHSFNAKHSH